jgi:hypothetical protein
MDRQLVPRPLYGMSLRDQVRSAITRALEAGVSVPPDMPVDTDDHMRNAIVYLARLTGKHVGE